MGHWKGAIRDQARRLGTRDSKKLPNSPVFQLGVTELGEGWDLKAGRWKSQITWGWYMLVWGNGPCQETW